MPPAVRALCGVNVAMVPVAVSRTTDAAVTEVRAGDGPVTVKVAALTVLESIRRPAGTVNVALTDAFRPTPAFPAAGLVDFTVAGARAATPPVPRIESCRQAVSNAPSATASNHAGIRRCLSMMFMRVPFESDAPFLD